MPQPQFGLWRWTIHRWNEHPNPFVGRPDLALLWLRQFEGDALFLQELRRLVGSPASLSGDDGRLIQEAAEQMSAGRLQICGEFCGHYQSPATDVKFAEAEEEAIPAKPPAPAPSPAPSTEETAQEASQSAFPPSTDESAMAEVLKSAAQDGTPFCEECAKAKQARTPAPAPVPVSDSTLPSDVDAAAIAEGLQKASQTGAPFCAECLKAWLNSQRQAGSGN